MGDRLFLADLVDGGARALEPAARPPFDPRPDPTGRRVAYVAGGALRVLDVASGEDRLLAHDDDPDVSWGLADFVAAEEMDRRRGYWWSPDGERIAAARVDDRPVRTWHIAGPVDPEAPPRAVRYPAAGTRQRRRHARRVRRGRWSRRRPVGCRRVPLPGDGRVERERSADVRRRIPRPDDVADSSSADPVDRGDVARTRGPRRPSGSTSSVGVPGYLADGRLVRHARLARTTRPADVRRRARHAGRSPGGGGRLDRRRRRAVPRHRRPDRDPCVAGRRPRER